MQEVKRFEFPHIGLVISVLESDRGMLLPFPVEIRNIEGSLNSGLLMGVDDVPDIIDALNEAMAAVKTRSDDEQD